MDKKMIVVNYEPPIMVNLILCTSHPKTNTRTNKEKERHHDWDKCITF